MGKKKNNNYLNNTDFLNNLRDFQRLNIEDITPWWRKRAKELEFFTKKHGEVDGTKKWNEQEEFFKACEKRLTSRIKQLKCETSEEKKTRLKELEKIKNKIGRKFLNITDGLIKKPCFINYDIHRKQDMISDATYFMMIYIDRYNCKKENPFSYFTQTAFNAYRQNINKINKNREIFTSLTYIENMDDSSNHIVSDGVYED